MTSTLKRLGYLHKYLIFTMVMLLYVYFYFHLLKRIYSFIHSFNNFLVYKTYILIRIITVQSISIVRKI